MSVGVLKSRFFNALRSAVAALLMAFAATSTLAATPSTAPSAGTAEYTASIQPVLENFCFDCHADGMKKGDLSLDTFASLDKHLENHTLWLAVWKNLQSQMMPPSNKKQPSAADRDLVLNWIEHTVFKVDASHPDPGRVTLRRLNREEYRNTVLDLLGVTFDTTEAFPPDDTGYGFDTIGDVLNLSPILMEKYLDAAREVSDAALEKSHPQIQSVTISPDRFVAGDDKSRTAAWMPFATKAAVEHSQEIDESGKYNIVVDMRVTGSDEATSHSANVYLRVNGTVKQKANVGWDDRKSIKLETSTKLPKGKVTIGFAIEESHEPLAGENSLTLVVKSVQINGPLEQGKKQLPKVNHLGLPEGAGPTDEQGREQLARRVIGKLADRAFRRPVDDKTLNALLALAGATWRQPGGTLEKGIGDALTAILASPRFLFRAETQPEPNNPGKVVRLDEFSLASRLSYFLWSSLPDEALFELARRGTLRASLHGEIDRMLADPKSDRFVQNFVGQWLETRDVPTLDINSGKILGMRTADSTKIFSKAVREGMADETEQCFAYMLRENRSVLELFTADYTFLNDKLAKFYGIPGIKGSEFRKVSTKPSDHRGGLLNQGSFHVVTSNPTRTSPVKRGLFILENILGTPTPPPPPNVPELEAAKKEAGKSLTMRQTMEIHRDKPLCASCHARMDPIGLSLENFNALGQWRESEQGKPIDTAGKLVTGESFQTIADLSKILATSRRMDFYRCLSSKLLTYAIGRGPEYYDWPTIRQFATRLDENQGALKTLIYDIVESPPFQMRRGDGEMAALPKADKPTADQRSETDVKD